MKASDFMIGDWVRNRFLPVGKGEYRVYPHWFSLFKDGELSDYGIEPIPLTPEILEKNGFDWDAAHVSQKLICGSVHICWGFYKNCLSMSDWDNNGDTQITSIRCEYVHQLQHVLHDCGIEKKIEL